MTFWELLGVVLSSAGLFASILGAFLTYAARKNGEATRALLQSTDKATRELIQSTGETTRALIQSMEERMSKMLERMDQRADERHREVIEAIKALRAT